MLVALGVLFNAAVGLFLAVPVVGYILSPVIRQRRQG
jgi:ethanolamine transporter EutH